MDLGQGTVDGPERHPEVPTDPQEGTHVREEGLMKVGRPDICRRNLFVGGRVPREVYQEGALTCVGGSLTRG